MSAISIVPINAIDHALLSRLALCLEERFLARVDVRRPLEVPDTVLNSARKQLFFGSFVPKLASLVEGADDIVLGVTEYDLYKTSHQFIFGSSSEGQRCGAVSLHRMRAEFYGDEPDANLLFQRLLKEAVHEVGHMLGLKHCMNARCPMYSALSIFDTDNKYSTFCEVCEKKTRAPRE